MATPTTNFGFSKPAVNNSTDQDLWGGEWNTNADGIDGVLKSALNWIPSAQTSTITVTAPTSGSTAIGNSKYFYLCNATGGGFAANLPAAATATNMVVAFKKTDSSGNAITITGNSSDNIDGSNTLTLTSQYAWVVIVCDGTEWNIISESILADFPAISAQSVLANATSSSATPTGLALAVSQLLGRGASGNLAAIILGSGLSMSGTTLNSSSASVTISGTMSSGYVSISNNGTVVCIIQCQSVAGTTSPNVTQNVTFPITFPSTVVAIGGYLSTNGANGGDVGYMSLHSAPSTSGCAFQSTTNRYVISVGY